MKYKQYKIFFEKYKAYIWFINIWCEIRIMSKYFNFYFSDLSDIL